jgi:hypothetical protein
MTQIIDGSFTSESLNCPVCERDLLSPGRGYCEHIAFFCVQDPVDDPQMEYLSEGLRLNVDDISSKKKMLKVGEEEGLSIYELTEKDAHYPTIIILGVKT